MRKLIFIAQVKGIFEAFVQYPFREVECCMEEDGSWVAVPLLKISLSKTMLYVTHPSGRAISLWVKPCEEPTPTSQGLGKLFLSTTLRTLA